MISAYFAYPADPASEPVKIHGADKGVFENGKYEAVAKQLLNVAAQAQVGNPLAVHLFRYGSIEYGKKLSTAGTFRRKELASR